MNKVVIKSLIIGVVIGLGVMLPLTASSGKNAADINQVSFRPSEQFQILPNITNTTNNASVPVKTLDTKDSAIVQLNTEVNEESVDKCIAEIKAANKKHVKKIFLLLDSPGGSVFDGSRLIGAMGASKAPVYTVVTGMAASMAAIITEYGKERYMMDRTTLMFHPASLTTFVSGEVDKVISRLSYGKREIDKMDVHTAMRSGVAYVDFKARTEQELWDDAEDALHDHFIDAIVDIDFVKEAPPAIDLGNQLKTDLQQLTLE